MSFELSPIFGARPAKVSSGSRLSIVATLISPLLAVCLSQYLHVREQHQTTFALPVQNNDARCQECRYSEPRSELSTAGDTPRDNAGPWQGSFQKSAKQALAKKLIGEANEIQDDPAKRFMLLRVAKDMAAQASDGQTAFQAIDATAATFPVDANTMKMAVLTKLASAAREPAQHKSIAEQASGLVNQAVGQDQFMVANRLGRLALAEAKKSFNRELVAKVQGQIADVAERVKARERRSK